MCELQANLISKSVDRLLECNLSHMHVSEFNAEGA